MILLEARMQSGAGGDLNAEIIEAWNRVVRYFEEGGRDRVESGVRDVIQAGLRASSADVYEDLFE